jgi:hypothetical protein
VVGDRLRIGVELLGAATGPSMAGGRWHWLRVQEAAWCCLIAGGGALGGGQRREARFNGEVLSELGRTVPTLGGSLATGGLGTTSSVWLYSTEEWREGVAQRSGTAALSGA